MRVPKLLFVVTEDWYFWSHRLDLARAAAQAGFDVSIATRVTDHGERIQGEGFWLFPIGLSRRSRNPFVELAAVLERVDPDFRRFVQGLWDYGARSPDLLAVATEKDLMAVGASALDARLIKSRTGAVPPHRLCCDVTRSACCGAWLIHWRV